MLRVDEFDTTDLSDGRLLARFREGDDDSFAALVQRHRAAAMSLARRALPGDAASAEDAVADAIAATLRAIRNGNGPDVDFRPYFLAATRTAAIRISGRRVPTTSSTDVLATDGSEFATIETAHELAVLNDCFHRLRPAWRQVLWQVDVDGVPSPAVADQLGVSRRAVDAVCQRARRHLARDYVAHLMPVGDGAACASLQHQLSDYGLGLASEGNGELLRSHLEHCPSCAARVEAVRRLPEQLPAVMPPAAVGAWKLLAALFISGGAAGVSAVGVACVLVLAPLVPSDEPANAWRLTIDRDADGPRGSDSSTDSPSQSSGSGDVDLGETQGDGGPTQSSPPAGDDPIAVDVSVDVGGAQVDTATGVEVTAGGVGVSVAPGVSIDPGNGTVGVTLPLEVTTPITTIAIDVGIGVGPGGAQVDVDTNLTVPVVQVTVPTVSIAITVPPITVPAVTVPTVTLPPVTLPPLPTLPRF